jgi:hypothetical protein
VIGGFAQGFAMVRAVAIGYAVEEASVQLGADGGELVITMRRDTLLRLRLLAPDGSPLRSVSCAITTDQYPFETKRTYSVMNSFSEMGASLHRGINRGAGVTLKFSPTGGSEGGRPVVVSGIRPGLPMRLSVINYLSNILEERDLAPLAPEEHREVDIMLERMPRDLLVRVVDEEGESLADSRVGIQYQSIDLDLRGTGSLSKSGTKNGEFLFKEIFAEHVDLDADCPGFIPFRNRELEVPKDGSPVEIQLVTGRDVLVLIEDEVGRPLAASIVVILPDGGAVVGSDLRTGKYMLRGLPDAAVTVTALMGATNAPGSAQIKRQLEARQAELRIVLPAVGQVQGRVALPSGIELSAKYWVWLLAEDEQLGDRAIQVAPPKAGLIDFAIEDVLAGKYSARVQRLVIGPDGAQDSEWISEGVVIEVTPGKICLIEL